MRRAVLATAATSSLVVLLLALKPHQPPGATGSGPPKAPHAPSRTAPGRATGTGTFTGEPIATRYGTVRVAVTLSKGRITAIHVLQAPDGNGRDRQIAGFALPRLTREALAAQSARIDAVSGASYTSQGYMSSLQSALDRAHA